MSDWTASQIKIIVDDKIADERRHRDSLRKEDRERFEEYKKTLIEALRVQTQENNRDRTELERRLTVLNHAHDEARRVLGTYALLKDFNELKERVSIELADRTGKSKSLPLIISIVGVVISLFVAAAVYLRH